MMSIDKTSNSLSEEILDLCSSFDTDTECDISLATSPLSFQGIRNNTDNKDNIFKTSKNFSLKPNFNQSSKIDGFTLDSTGSPFSQNDSSNAVSLFNTPENRSLSIVRKFDCLSLDDGQFLLTSKIKEFKSVLSDVNDAYLKFMTNQFLLHIYKVIKRKVSPELANKVEEAVTGSVVEKLYVLKSKKGERYHLLGLETDQICAATKGTLSSNEKAILNKHAVAELTSNVENLSSQQKSLKGMFGAHCQKVVQPESLLCEEKERLVDLHNCVHYQLDTACQLLASSNQLMQQLAQVLQTSEQELAVATFTSLRDKTKYLHSTACVLRLKIEERLFKDKNQTKALNNLGSKLKNSVDAVTEDLKSLQKTLGQYEAKEETSRQYKGLVADYAITKRQLQHKYQTLNLLKDPDMSFT